MNRVRREAAMRGRRGSVLMIVLILMSLLAAIPIMMQLVTTNNNSSRAQLNEVAQANNMARAGLLDAINWFRRQNNQPVSSLSQGLSYPDAAFQPVYSTNTTQSDTMDANIGIMEQYQIDSNGLLWGRYEVRKATSGVSYPTDPNSVHDITPLRIPNGSAGAGSVWYIESTGYIFKNANPSLAYNVSPNQVMGTAKIVTEISRVTLALPIKAAVIINSQGSGTNVVTLTNNAYILGGSNTAIGYYYSSANIAISGSGYVSGSSVSTQISTGAVNPITIFGMSSHNLSLIADYSVSSLSQLPTSYPSAAIVYYNGSATFTTAQQLNNGGGILYVTGALTVPATTIPASFSGAIYTGGNASLSAMTMGGCLIIGGSGTLSANGSGDKTTITYNNNVINLTQQEVAQYRESRSEYYTFTAYK